MQRAEKVERTAALPGFSPLAPARAPASPSVARLPSEGPQLPVSAAAQWGNAAVAPLSAADRMTAHLQMRARDPMGAIGMGAGGRLTALPGEKAPVNSDSNASAEHEPAAPETGGPEAAITADPAKDSAVHSPLASRDSPSAVVQKCCGPTCSCAKCRAARGEGDEEGLSGTLRIQREARPGAGPPAVNASEVRTRLGSGARLPEPVLQKFSNAYGRDLSSARIHSSHSAADQLGARAFTVGRDIAFAPGEYRPGTTEGDRLIGHELAHVVQRSGGEGTVQGAGLSEDGYEKEADHAADRALSGHRVSRFSAVGAPSVQKDDKDKKDKSTWDQVKDFGQSTVGAVADTAKEGILAAIRLVSPALASFLSDPLGYLEERLLPALASWVQGLFGVDIGEVVGEAKTALTELTSTLSGVVAGDEKACLAFASAVQKVRDLYQQLKSHPVIQKIGAFLSSIRSGFDKVSRAVLSPAFDLLRKVAGGAWTAVTKVAEKIGAAIDVVKAKVSGAVDWISKKLGFSDGPGLLGFLREKAQQVWAKVQKTLSPVATPLKVLLGVSLAMNPATWTYLIFKYGPDVIEAAKWLWAHKSDPSIVESAKDGKHPVLARILSTVQNLGAAVTGAASKAGSALSSGVTAALSLAGQVTGLPILSSMKGVADSLGKGLQSLATSVGGALRKAGAWVSKVAAKVADGIAPIQGVLLKLGMALVNPSSIPVMLAGWAWTKLPDCYKGPIIDLILDALIGILDASPSNPVFGPLWALLKPGIVGFVRQLRKMSTPIKVEVSNKIATFMSAGSPQFLLGYAKGLLVGLWDNTAGTVGDLIELGHTLQSLVEGAISRGVAAILGTPAKAGGGETLTAHREKPGEAATARKIAPAAGDAQPATPPTGAAQAPSAQAPSAHAPSAQGTGPAPAGAAPSSEMAKAAAEAAPAAPALPKLDKSGVTETEITRDQLDAYRPKDEPKEGAEAPAPITQEQFQEEAGKLRKDIQPSAAIVASNAGGALKEYFKSGSGMTYDQLAAKLGDAWGAAQNLISAQGAKMAREAVAVLLGKDGDFVVGEKVGWVAGMIIVEVVTDYLTAGGAAVAKQAANAAKAAKAATKPVSWTARAVESIGAAFSRVASFLKELPNKLRQLASDAKSTMKRVLDALRDAGRSIAAFVERLLGKARRVEQGAVKLETKAAKAEAGLAKAESAAAKAESRAAKAESAAARAESGTVKAEAGAAKTESGAAKTESGAAKTESGAAKTESGAAKVEDAHGGARKEGRTDVGTPAERDASVKESGHIESNELTRKQVDSELQHIQDNPHLIEGEAPHRRAQIGEHSWEEAPGGMCCRRSKPQNAICESTAVFDEAQAATLPKAVENDLGRTRKSAFETLEDVNALPGNHPGKFDLKQEADSIRKELEELQDLARSASPEEMEKLVKPELDALEKKLDALRSKVPAKAPQFPEGASTKLSQAGGLQATEGTRIQLPDGSWGPPSHPLKEHGPNADPNWLRKMVENGDTDQAAKFTDRAVMETVIGDAMDANEQMISRWLAGNPPAGQKRILNFEPELGNLGEGFMRVGDKVVPIPSNMPLENVVVVLKADGNGGYIIQTAYPTL